MKLKKYLQFINESINNSIYWIDKEQIEDIFRNILDEGYIMNIDSNIFFGYYGYSNRDRKLYDDNKNLEDLVLFDIEEEDVILIGESYHPGYRITLITGQYKSDDDLTDEFKSAISQLKGEDYIIGFVLDDEDKTNLENIHLYKGSIITWIPEVPNKPFTTKQDEMVDGDIYMSSSKIDIIIYQSESIELNAKNLAEIYNWKCDKIENNNIYCHVDIDAMARSILSRNSYERWGKILESGSLDEFNYYGDEYEPEIISLFEYELDKDNKILLVKALIKELGGLESTLKELEDSDISKELVGKSEDEVIEILLKERFLRAINQLGKNSDIINSVRQTVGEWSAQAHCSQNWEDLIDEFDEVVSNVTEYKKIEKELEKYYRKKGSEERIYYKTMVTHYEIPFDIKWILDYAKPLKGYSLDSIFYEWCSDEYLDYNLNPNFKDYGHVDSKELNKEIKSIINYYV
jgi:hypothetical protein